MDQPQSLTPAPPPTVINVQTPQQPGPSSGQPQQPYDPYKSPPTNPGQQQPPAYQPTAGPMMAPYPPAQSQTFQNYPPQGQYGYPGPPPMAPNQMYGGPPQGAQWQYPPPGQNVGQYNSPYPPYQPPQQQQQQQTVIIGGAPMVSQPVIFAQSFAGHYTLACFSMWCCGFVFGLIGFILAALGSNIAVVNPMQARQYGRASLWVSSAGICVGVFIIIIISSVLGTSVSHTDYARCCNAYHNFVSCSTYNSYSC